MIDPNVYPSSKRIFIFWIIFCFSLIKKKKKERKKEITVLHAYMSATMWQNMSTHLQQL